MLRYAQNDNPGIDNAPQSFASARFHPMKKPSVRAKPLKKNPRRPIPINEAEAVIDGFWDKDLSPLANYELTPAAASVRAPKIR